MSEQRDRYSQDRQFDPKDVRAAEIAQAVVEKALEELRREWTKVGGEVLKEQKPSLGRFVNSLARCFSTIQCRMTGLTRDALVDIKKRDDEQKSA